MSSTGASTARIGVGLRARDVLDTGRMESKEITCPRTGRPEQIEIERTPFGPVIAKCSRFVPACNVTCGGHCATRLDWRERDEDRTERVLVVYANAQYTEAIARQLRTLLSLDGLVVELADADLADAPPPEDYDAVIVGTAPRFWRQPRAIEQYIAQHRNALSQMPAFLYFVGDSGARELGLLAERTGWLPRASATFARPDRAGLPHHEQLRSFALFVGDAIPALPAD